MSNRFDAFSRVTTKSICAALVGASVLIFGGIAWPSFSQAASTFLGSANLDYAGLPSYCSDPCLTPAYPSAGQVTVSVESGPNSFLHFDVQLATGFTFMYNNNGHGTSFAFGLDVAGASITNITPIPSGGTWTPQSNVAAGDGVGTTWPYGLKGTSKISNEIQFDVSKTGTDLGLANLIQILDKHNVALWFIADVSNPLGKTGFVGATTSFTSTSGEPIPTPLPVTLPLFATGFGMLSLLGWRRKRAA